ncbi:MAG: type VI secretion system membrane subunit TssM [Methylococcales bacterium]|nr:type VI secretion system membrane subunit TssM [Methylococcales bacterium]
MKKLFNFIKQRWFVSLLGVIFLGLLIWFMGPLFAFGGYEPLESENHRLVLIAVIALFWLVVRIWNYFNTRIQNNKVLAAMAESPQITLSPDEQASQDELQKLQEGFQEALEILKKARLGGRAGRQFLYQLPWYILIGPPGSGKSTLLKTSDLKFPLSNHGKDSIRGVGGTRNCDWWFTDEAVLLDTAGRFATQDSHEKVDQASWLGFLDLLKKYRPRRPINGVIITMSIEDLLSQNQAEQQETAIKIRKRIQELMERFNMRFPIYLLFTKCDLLAGFMEYFDELDRDKRSQVWGMTFKLNEDANAITVNQFSAEFELLSQRLQNQLIDKLEHERGSERRNFIYTFPQQFNSLKDLIAPFLEEIFQSTRLTHTPMLRGVYFTSATQEGSPIDRIMGSLASSFGLDRQSIASARNQGKSFFINRLLSDVIFAESGLAGANLKLENKRAWLQRGAFLASIAFALLISLLWLTSFIRNKAYIQEVSEQTQVLKQGVSQINPEQTDPLPLLPLLNAARNLPGGYADQKNGTPLTLTFGLYQGDKLGSAADELYRKLLKQVFLSRLMFRIEEYLQDQANSSDHLIEALKVYLMLNDKEHYDPNTIRDWFINEWRNTLPLDVGNVQRQALFDHLNALLETRPAPLPRPLDRNLIHQTRAILENAPIADRVYAQLKSEPGDANIPGFQVSEKSGRDVPFVLAFKSGEPLTKGVPALFTCAGYQNIFLKNFERIIDQQAVDNWVLGTEKKAVLTDAELKELRETVLKKYLEDYKQHWDDLLSDIEIKPFSNQAQLFEILNIASGEHSPLRLLLQAIDKETSFACLTEKDKSLLDKAGKTLNTVQSRLENLMSSTTGTQASAPQVTINLVTEHFKELHELVQAKDGAPPRLDSSLATLNELGVHLNSLMNAPEAMLPDQQKQVIQVIEKIKLDGKRNPFPVNKMLDNLAASGKNLITGGGIKFLNDKWKSSVLPFCQKAIQGLYPIFSSTREITFDDFTAFFAPNGLMDDFFNKYLAESVDRTGPVWHWNDKGGASPSISSASLRQFQLADSIKNTYFRMGKQSPTVSFKLKPISMSPDINEFIMDIDGQALTYAHGPQRPVSMKWPGPKDSGQVTIQLLPPLQGNSGISKEGPWALFRLFDEANISRTSNPTTFIITFNIQGREAKFELSASSAINPFQLSDLHSFRCLPNL